MFATGVDIQSIVTRLFSLGRGLGCKHNASICGTHQLLVQPLVIIIEQSESMSMGRRGATANGGCDCEGSTELRL